MVQDHQFSVGFSDLILVGCGTVHKTVTGLMVRVLVPVL